MSSRLKFLFALYRWGEDLLGGAELLHRRLAFELLELGHEVEVWTTTGHKFEHFAHWGERWTEFHAAGDTLDNGIKVRRFPMRPQSKLLMGIFAKALQFEWERHAVEVDPRRLFLTPERILLGPDWHEAESAGEGLARRWSWARSSVFLAPGGRESLLTINGYTPRPQQLQLRCAGPDTREVVKRQAVDQHFSIQVTVPATREAVVLQLRAEGAFRPPKDFRELGVLVSDIFLDTGEASYGANMWIDARPLARDSALVARAAKRPPASGMLFDYLRGPNSPALQRALARESRNRDVIFTANLPWRLFDPPKVTRGGAIRTIMPLMHLGDSYYYWSHYFDAMRGADLNLAINQASGETLFKEIGAKSAFIGPPIWPDERLTRLETKRANSKNMPVVVFTLSRKTGEKRYMEIAASVGRLRAAGLPLVMIGAGPDADGAPLPEGCRWLGRLSEDELVEAWANAHIFVLVSESESFGMVIVEAWHAGLPVVVNRRCRAAASLVEHDVDGYVVSPGGELDSALELLAEDAGLRARLAAAGRRRARQEFVRGAAGKRFVQAVEPLVRERRK